MRFSIAACAEPAGSRAILRFAPPARKTPGSAKIAARPSSTRAAPQGTRRAAARIQPRSQLYLRDLLLYRLTLAAQKRLAEGPLSKRQIERRLGAFAAQLYRLFDQTNYRKSVDQVLALLQVLNCDADVVVRAKTALREARPRPESSLTV